MKDDSSKLRFYALECRDLWGSDGRALISGMVTDAASDGITICRTGPFVPALTLPSFDFMVVTPELMKALKESGLGSFEFRKVNVHPVADIPWHRWDLNAPNPPDEFMERGVAIDQIEHGEHSPNVAVTLGELFEVYFPVAGAQLFAHGGGRLEVRTETWDGSDFFVGNANGSLVPIVTEAGKVFLEKYAGEWISFREISTAID